MKQQQQWSAVQHDADLQLDALHAHFTTHAFTRHWHDYYVIGLVEDGAQSFWCRHDTYTTPRGGLIMLNPGEPHTGEAMIAAGFTYRALYPTAAHIAQAMAELGRPNELPLFPAVRIDDEEMAATFRTLHSMLGTAVAPLERETRWLRLLLVLVTRYGAERLRLPAAGQEPRAIQQTRAFIEEHHDQRIMLAHLAQHAGLSPYHLVRVFQRATGMPPHVYHESVRVRHAQTLLAQGRALADVAYAVGFSSQSHFTSRFRQIIGVTPGHYRQLYAAPSRSARS